MMMMMMRKLLYISAGRMTSSSMVTARCVTSSSHLPTIFSLSSGHGKCGVAVVRVSGTRTSSVLLKLCKMTSLPKPRYASLRRIYCPHSGGLLDKGIIIWFPGPGSFTGEDLCEFHVHGSIAVVRALYDTLGHLDGVEPADPGDFTRRAFINNKLDLTEVEALSDLIHSETEAQRKISVRQLNGELKQLYEQWTVQILKCVANVEAMIDFSEDETIDPDVLDEVTRDVSTIQGEINSHLCDTRKGEMLRSGVRVVIVGKPNVGKSSLINIISQRQLSIVSPVPGTTRDVIETTLDIGGYPVVISDTAGLRHCPGSEIEQEGVRRAWEQLHKSDLIIAMSTVTDTDTFNMSTDTDTFNMSTVADTFNMSTDTDTFNKDHLQDIMTQTHSQSDQTHVEDKEIIYVLNKSDIISDGQLATLVNTTRQYNNVQLLSCKTKDGLSDVLDMMKSCVERLCGGDPSCGGVTITQGRQHYHLKQCLHSLESYNNWDELDLAAEELRMALFHIGKITGRVGAEEILDVIFRDFCIGK